MKRFDRCVIRGCFFLLMTFSACTGSSSGEGADGTNGDRPEVASKKIPVALETIKLGNVDEIVSAMGTVFAVHDILVSPEIAGTVKSVQCEVGQQVRAGQVLLKLDEELKQLMVDQAAAALLEARAARDKSARDFERNKKLFESKDISDFVFENARLQKESGEAAYLAAVANHKIALRQLRNTSIRSPIDGLMANRMVELGMTIAPAVPIARIVDISQVKIKFGVAENDVAKIAERQAAEISLDAIPGHTFAGEVSGVAPQADLATRTFPVEVLVDNPDARIKAGMIAEVNVSAQKVTDIPLLPRSALLERGGKTIFFVVKDGRAEEREPEIGIESGDAVVLISGAMAGEKVVVLGQENLSTGSEVIEQ